MEHKKTLTEKFIEWCNEDTPDARMQRTIAQGIVGAIIVAIPQMVELVTLPEWASGLLVACIMAILAPVQAHIGKKADNNG